MLKGVKLENSGRLASTVTNFFVLIKYVVLDDPPGGVRLLAAENDKCNASRENPKFVNPAR
jgi:hypothetical protein